jgi:ABC-2 type transport system permease protein
MSRMAGYRELLEKEVIEASRTYRLALVCVLFVVLGIAAPVLARYLPDLTGLLVPPDTELGLEETGVADVLDVLLRHVVQFGAVAAVLLTMGSIAGEKERGTAALVLARPVSRAAFLLAKFVTLGMLLALGTGLGVLAAWLYTGLLFEPVPVVPWVQLALIAWLSTMVYVSITFAGSAAAGTALGAGAVGLAGLIVLSLASTVPPLNPWLPTGLLDVAKTAALEDASVDLDPARTILVSLGVIVGALLLAWWRFRREEL